MLLLCVSLTINLCQEDHFRGTFLTALELRRSPKRAFLSSRELRIAELQQPPLAAALPFPPHRGGSRTPCPKELDLWLGAGTLPKPCGGENPPTAASPSVPRLWPVLFPTPAALAAPVPAGRPRTRVPPENPDWRNRPTRLFPPSPSPNAFSSCSRSWAMLRERLRVPPSLFC